ncbi:hemagglutinin repeat-containing protein [Carnimonas bestiolae]|uniref:hemagglutinin repeat-containing protein n=1 Tax=Carnimonas bestiolae TaxID=3402172 RepID=UPI003EDBEE03
MNKQCFRLVFNRTRHMLVAVSEQSSASDKSTSQRRRGGSVGARPPSALAAQALLLGLTLTASPLLLAANIAADHQAPKNQQPTINRTGNGTPQVDIRAPNAQGLSHNTYQQFDVDQKGVILNNSRHGANTQLAGKISGNPWLGKREASTILNEVNNSRAAQLNGFIEVAGHKANVIIASPSGIHCNGCGFINVNRATLAAGQAQIENGRIAGYRVERGNLSLDGNGMNATGADYTTLIGRAVSLNARLQANQLKLTLGHNQTDAEGNVTQVLADDAAGRPQFALDSAALGGMYANSITLMGTEQGVGVRNAGEIGALAGDLQLDANGKLSNSGTLYASQAANIQSQGLSNSGAVNAAQALNAASHGDVDNHGSLHAGDTLHLSADGQLHSTSGSAITAGANTQVKAARITADADSAFGAGIDDTGHATRNGDLNLTASGQLSSHATQLSHDALNVSASALDISNSRSNAQHISLTATQGDISTDGAVLNATSAQLNSQGKLSNRGGSLSAEQLAINATNAIDNQQGLIEQRAQQGLTLTSQHIDNHGGTLSSGGDLTLNSQTLNNQAGQIGTDHGNLSIGSDQLAGAHGKLIASQALNVHGHSLNLDDGISQGDSIKVQAEQLSQQRGQLLQTGSGEARISARDSLDNRNAKLVSRGSLTLDGGQLDNSGGLISASGGNVALNQQGQITNEHGTIESARDVALKGAGLNNQNGQLTAVDGSLNASLAQAINNQHGQLQAGQDVVLNAGRLDNQHGVVSASRGKADLSLRADADNREGHIAAGQRLEVAADSLNNQQGRIEADQGMTLAANSLNNERGRIASNGPIALKVASGELDNAHTNTDGLGILSGGDITLHADRIDNATGSLSARTLTLDAQAINNREGYLGGDQHVSLSGDTLDNQHGLISAGEGDAQFNFSGQLHNEYGTLQAAKQLSLKGAGLNNQHGKLLAADGPLMLESSGDINNSDGSLIGTRALQLTADNLNNQNGLISSQQGSLSATTKGSLKNQGGRIESLSDQTLQARELNNRQGTLVTTEGGISATTQADINNQKGQVEARQQVTLSGAHLNNQSGQITAFQGPLTLSATGNIDNSEGVAQSNQAVKVTAASLNNQHGTLNSAQANLNVHVDDALDNARGTLSAQQALALQAGSLTNQQGRVVGDQVNVDSGALNNQAGLVQGSSQLSVDTHGQALDNRDTNSPTTGLRSGGQLNLASGDLDNGNGLLAANSLTLSSQQLANQHGVISSAQDAHLTTHGLDNSYGQLQAGGALTLDNQDSTINNQDGQLLADGPLKVTTGTLDNSADGVTQGSQGLTLKGDALNNQHGRLLSGTDMDVQLDQLDNRQGQLYASDNGNVSARQQIDNREGLLKADHRLTLTTPTLNNQATRSDGHGIEAGTLLLNTRQLDNQNGALRAVDSLQTQATDSFNNQAGLISSQHNLQLGQPDHTLKLDNSDGDVVANGDATLDLAQLTNSGRITSGGSLAVSLDSALDQRGTLAANHDLTLDSHGNALTNSGTINAGDTLTVRSGALDNQASGDINAGTTRLEASSIDNRGIIDGGNVRLTTDRLHNTGTGRIYGDQLAIDARALTNDSEDGKAATIAAREQLLLAGNSLTNREHGLIYSAGDMGVGGQLDEAGSLSGNAASLTNDSATIEAMGNLQLAATQITNRDSHLKISDELTAVSEPEQILDVELCSGKRWVDACGRTNGERYRIDGSWHKVEHQTYWVDFNYDAQGRSYLLDEQGNRVKMTNSAGQDDYAYIYKYPNDDDVLYYHLPGINDAGKRMDVFSYTRTVKEQQVTQQDSAVMRSGGNLLVKGDLHNQDSQIVAGQTLDIEGAVHNDDTEVKQQISEDGVRMRGGRRKKHKHTHFEGLDKYQPETKEQQVPLHLATQKEHQGVGAGVAVDARQTPTGQQGSASDVGSGPALNQGSSPISLTEVDLPTLEAHDGNLTGTDQLEHTPSDGRGTTTDGDSPTLHGSAATNDWVVRSVDGPVTLPDASLYQLHPGSDSHYLVETDPRFTRGQGSVSSLDVYGQDQLQKRLGDGYYEQSLVRDQVTHATGQRFLDGYNNDEEQYRALLNNGKAFTEQYGIAPGVDLSPEQMALMTTDMVIMVNQPVTLPNGTTQTVSVPKLYARVHKGDLNGTGALLSGHDVQVSTANDILNSGAIGSRGLTRLSGHDLVNTGDISGQSTQLLASHDLVNTGGQLKGEDQLALQAGHDLTSLTASDERGSEAWLERPASLYVSNDKGELSLSAGNNLTLTATTLNNAGNDSHTTLSAGNDLVLNTAATRHSTDYTRGSKDFDRSQQSSEVGSTINANGDIQLSAGHDMNLRAANVAASDGVEMQAGHDINLDSGQEEFHQQNRAHWKNHGFMSSTTHDIYQQNDQTHALSSTVSGDTVTATAGHDLSLHGSNIAATHDADLAAGHDIRLDTADEADHQLDIEKKKKSGLGGLGGGALGFSVGTSKQKTTQSDESNIKQGSVVGSSDGNVSMSAGHQVTIHGSDVVAGKDLDINAKDVAITAAENSHTAISKVESESSGFGVSLGGAAGGALNTSLQTLHQAQHQQDNQLSALMATKATLSGVQAGQALQLDQARGSNDPGNTNTIGVNAGFSHSKSSSEQRVQDTTASGSTLSAGRDLHIHASDGDIHAKGATLKAGRDTDLAASRDIVLESADNRHTETSSNHASGSSIGMTAGVGSGGMGYGVQASGYKGKGHENTDALSHQQTTVDSGRQVTLTSGRDTTLAGAQVSGERITADVGRNLTITSDQDRERFDSKQKSSGGSVSAGPGVFGGGVNAGHDDMHSDYHSVTNQSGLYAGKDGFDVNVGQHTQLNGGVIASTGDASNNHLSTGTLGFSDIDNNADYKVSHSGMGYSTGGGAVTQFVSNLQSTNLNTTNHSGHDSSTTHAAVSPGQLTIREGDKQAQDVSTLSRDPEHAGNALSPIFDKEKEQRRLDRVQQVSDLGTQLSDIVATDNQIARINERHKVQDELEQRGITPPGDDASDAQRTAYANTVDNMVDARVPTRGVGSDAQRLIQSATAVMQGLVSGDIGKGLANASEPELNRLIHQATDQYKLGEQGNLALHAMLGAVIAEVNDNSALSGAAGATSAEALATEISKRYYHKSVAELTDDEKANLSSLTSLAAGLVGAATGDNASDAVRAAGSGKSAVENNYLALIVAGGEATVAGCARVPTCANAIVNAGLGFLLGIAIHDTSNPMNQLSIEDQLRVGLALRGKVDVEQLTPAQRTAYDYTMEQQRQKGVITTFPQADNDLTGGKLVNPAQDQHKGTTLVTPDQSDQNGATHTGDSSDAPDLGGNTYTNPITDQDKGDNVYLSGSYKSNTDAVGNMGEFLNRPGFGNDVKINSRKTNRRYQGQTIYTATKKIGDSIQKGDQFYLDGLHKDHLEVFDKNGDFKQVQNLDGSINRPKTTAGTGRSLK